MYGIKEIIIESFKSLESVTVKLGLLNVFIGANGSGKSNFLEGIGVLSAAVDGRVNDQTLLMRGVRPGTPQLYKSSFKNTETPSCIAFTAKNTKTLYHVELDNADDPPKPNWLFLQEHLRSIKNNKEYQIQEKRNPQLRNNIEKDRGFAVLRAAESNEKPPIQFIRRLQDYRIYTPTTPVLRSMSTDTQPHRPLGLSGGRLPEAVHELLLYRDNYSYIRQITDDFFPLISWADEYRVSPISSLLTSNPSRILKFQDRFMANGRNVVSGYDASEGAMYVLFLAALVAHLDAPTFCAIENADYGLNPRLVKTLFQQLSQWVIDSPVQKQLLITTHNPIVLDGLPIQDNKIRLFVVNRTNKGKTDIKRILPTEQIIDMGKKGHTLSELWVMGLLGGVPDV
ncbi:MAG: AAA family ATPase [Planctomycetaceae bacterium]|jgi:AAA15 family ATPase/GTPase|nr:AAA family ATPase [Planctomycetaceae bacterium]